MKRTISLNERQLSRLVRRVINEAIVINRFDALYKPQVGVVNTAWPQQKGATGTWKEHEVGIILYDKDNKYIGSIMEG